MEDAIYSLNGRLVPADKAVVHVTDRGFLYGDGLFETLHAYGARLFRLEEHLKRLAHGAERLFIQPPRQELLAGWLNAAVAAGGFAEANVRLTVTRGTGGPRGPGISGPFTPTTVIMVTPYARPALAPEQSGTSAIVASFRRQEAAALASYKTLNYLEQILARREADAAGAGEALLLNNAGLLCEGSASNICLIRDGTLALPEPVRAGALAGLAQLTVLEAAGRLKIPARAGALSLWDLQQADEAFLTGSMREITPLVKLAAAPIGSGQPGPLTLGLRAEYYRIVERECAPFRFPEC